MKHSVKLLSLILAIVMLVGIVPMSANAGDDPVAENLTVTNAVDGVCGATVALSWQKNVSSISTGVGIIITKSYDGSNFTQVAYITNNVNKTTSYTYTTKAEDNNRTVYFGVAYGWSETTTYQRCTVSVKIKTSSGASDRDTLFAALANGTKTKTTANYNGTQFVAGTKAMWDCSLYTVTAVATKVNKAYVAFALTVKSKLAASIVPADAYQVTVVTNYPDGYNSISGKSGQTINFVVNTAARDPFDFTSPAGGMQFFKIRVEKTFTTDTTYSSNPYFANIVKNHEVYPENSNYFSRVYIDDEYFLGYYVKPTYKLNTNAFKVSQNAIALGTNAFPCFVYYRVKGARSWAVKGFGKNKAIVLSGLKPNTIYQINPVCVMPYTDPETGKVVNYKAALGAFYLTTAINQVPYLAQVKVSNVKYGKQTIPGYWESDGDWHPTETFNTATYTLTLKMRAVPANVKGLVIKVAGANYYLKGRKGTYATTMTYRAKGAVKGKKVAVVLAYSSNTIGYSAVGIGSARTIYYKLQNSATNYTK